MASSSSIVLFEKLGVAVLSLNPPTLSLTCGRGGLEPSNSETFHYYLLLHMHRPLSHRIWTQERKRSPSNQSIYCICTLLRPSHLLFWSHCFKVLLLTALSVTQGSPAHVPRICKMPSVMLNVTKPTLPMRGARVQRAAPVMRAQKAEVRCLTMAVCVQADSIVAVSRFSIVAVISFTCLCLAVQLTLGMLGS